jgi:ketosteroid isomerase-like protein
MALPRQHVQQTKTELAYLVFDAFNRRDIDAAIAIVDDEVQFFAPTAEMANEGKPYVGHAGMRKYYDDVAAVWQELEVTPSEIREVDDAVLVLGRVYGRADGGYIQDSPAQWVMRFRDDRVSWIHVYTNRSAALSEVGLEE